MHSWSAPRFDSFTVNGPERGRQMAPRATTLSGGSFGSALRAQHQCYPARGSGIETASHHRGIVVGRKRCDAFRHARTTFVNPRHLREPIITRPHPRLQCGENGCLDLWRRTRIACGFLSRRVCAASTTCSCSGPAQGFPPRSKKTGEIWPSQLDRARGRSPAAPEAKGRPRAPQRLGRFRGNARARSGRRETHCSEHQHDPLR
jgi:hypothetical protein